MATLNQGALTSFHPLYLIRNISSPGEKPIPPKCALNCSVLRTQLWGLLHTAFCSCVLSYNEHHQHWHFNMYNESQLNVSSWFKDYFPQITISLEKPMLKAAITLKSLLEDNGVNLITEEDQLPHRNPAPKIWEGKEVSCVPACCSDEKGKERICFFFLRILEGFAFCPANAAK